MKSNGKSRTYQKPRSDHPWKTAYKVNLTKTTTSKEFTHVKSMQVFIREISDSWDEVEIVTTAFGREGRFKLVELPQSKQAAWLAGILRRNYA